MLLPIKNMSYLPIIRFKSPVNNEVFDLSLHYPYLVNGKIIVNTNFSRTDRNGYIIDQELNTYHLPYDYADIISNALRLHRNIYNCSAYHADPQRIITELKGIHRLGDEIEYITRLVRGQNRDCSIFHNTILYDTTCNKAHVYDCNGNIVSSIRLNQIATLSHMSQRGRRSEVTFTFEDGLNINNFNRLIDNVRASSNSCEFEREYFHSFVSSRSKTYIHQFNYVPKYIKHFIPGESEGTTLLLGAEIEVGGNNNISSDNDKNSTVKKCIQIMNGSDSDVEDLIYSTHDSTVQIEFDTMPCSLEFHKNKMNYREMFEYLDKEGYKGHDCETAGLHIHANRSYLGKSRISQELVISKILYILEKFNDEICVIARRDNDYSEFAGERQNEDSIVELYSKYKDKGKRAALNLQHKDTIEFRMFKSTLKYETFILTLEFVKDIIDYAKSVDIEEIELAKWSDLMNCFSSELRKYYEFRYQKKVKDINGSTVKQIRKRISKLKSELKNSKNFFEKNKLQQEYCYLKKEYKKLNKKEKKVTKMKLRIAESETFFSVPVPATSADSYVTISRNLNLRI